MNDAPILTHRQDHVLVITLNRPKLRNAVNVELAEALSLALEKFDADPLLRVGVLTGAGGNFCSGMDLKDFAQGRWPFLPDRGFAGMTQRPPTKPLVAAVEGYALAGGFEIALACDLLVASADARFGLPEVRRGLAAVAGGLMRLPVKLPRAKAMELALTGRMMDAAEAQESGLLNRLVPAGTALDAALQLAGEIAANAPLAVVASKQVVLHSRSWSEMDMFDRQEAFAGAIRFSQDALEGARAFAEKRQPVWQGK
jgi:enoyl-CoA hydratase